MDNHIQAHDFEFHKLRNRQSTNFIAKKEERKASDVRNAIVRVPIPLARESEFTSKASEAENLSKNVQSQGGNCKYSLVCKGTSNKKSK